jgi:transposase InsO family protein
LSTFTLSARTTIRDPWLTFTFAGLYFIHRYWKRAFEAWLKPNIFNTDQGSQFTSFAITNTLREAGIDENVGGPGVRLRKPVRGKSGK